ncbi:MAG: hypothetical protein QOJ16_1495 [Acidobacteriota bacterium]|jgi:hypothetical protein|nr:hypothetical protein [Acidobacteriota bacterium]
MVRGIENAVAELKRDPEHPVTAEIDGLVVELRVQGRRTAGDIFREIGPWEGESAEELMNLLREARAKGGSGEPPAL